MYASLICAAAVLAVMSHALPVAEAPVNEALVPGDYIQRLDASSNCLSPVMQSLSGSGRVVLDSVARELQASMFRDFHQFAPAALALGRPEIETKILGTDYKSTISGLRDLKGLFNSELAEISTTSESSVKCNAPTAHNLRVIYANLDKLLQQFV
ncbi:hypothetical protein IWW37_002884 [Coemansia sp. RSA 2050]|nr:hypothetical protein IWW37_002884 [Coemansia sp. RSA 2050]KAJ2733892.1 hypothetical protein IW152_002757 [Coemansia sp. BCRC 34962]